MLRYVGAHPEVFGGVQERFLRQHDTMRWLQLVTTAGDVAQASKAVRARWSGPVCVRAVPHSRAQALAAWAVIHSALTNPQTAARYGLIGGEQTMDAAGDPRARMTVLVWTDSPESLRRSARASAGADVVDIDPLLRKIG